MPKLSQEKIDEIRQSVDIVDVIGQYLPLTKKGRNYMAICPFHDDTNPSMSISPQKQIYMCFVCHNGGNVFTFLQDYLHISYIEAVKKVAEMGHVDISEYHLESRKVEVKQEYKALYDMHTEANRIYHYFLNTKAGVLAKDYLKDRHFDDEMIEAFQIGYAPSENVLFKAFEKMGFSEIDMVKSGLVIESERHYDRFNDRIMFALHDEYGRVVGFSGRIYKPTQKDSKYMNSPESNIFIKGKTLYNYDHAKEYVKQDGFVYILEGFMDVIAMFKANHMNCIALMGTALTQDHIRMLKRMTNSVVLCLDGDHAGKAAASKAASVLVENGFQVKVVVLPNGNDPDEILNRDGVNGLNEVLKYPLSPIEFFMDFEYEEVNSQNYDDRKTYLEKICKELSHITDEIDLDHYVELLSQKSGFSKDIIRGRLSGVKTQHTEDHNDIVYEVKKTRKLIDKYQKAEHDLLFYMMIDKSVSDKYETRVGYMYNDSYRVIASYIVDYYRTHMEMDIADLINRVGTKDLIQYITEISSSDLPVPCDEQAIEDYIATIAKNAKRMKKEQLLEQFNYVLDPTAKSEILKEIVELEKE